MRWTNDDGTSEDMTVAELEAKVAAGEIVMPSHAEVSRRLSLIGRGRGDWAGIPMPKEGYKLRLCPWHPYKWMEDLNEDEIEAAIPLIPVDATETCVNHWVSRRAGKEVFVLHTGPPERRRATCLAVWAFPHDGVVKNTLRLMDLSDVWPEEAEAAAMDRLREHLSPTQWRRYQMTCSFIERSPRSGLCYVFRRSRPTIALRPSAVSDDVRVLSILCFHPLGYYHDTMGGIMCPSDEVIAHLLMMRADEHLYWKRCNQHSLMDSFALLV